MKAAILQDGKITVDDVADPVPASGQALVRVHSCGLCASDAHFYLQGPQVAAAARRFGGLYAGLDFTRPIIMGHEFVGEILDYGPESRRPLAVGSKATSMPVLLGGPGGHSIIGQNHQYPGGFGELILLDENIMMAVPSDLDDTNAAMIEPLAVGLEHARSGEPSTDDVILVVGCGAIGLGVIAGLKLMGMGPVIASDLDPARRELALKMGADAIIDPREVSPYEGGFGIGTGAPTLIFECVGVPGMLDQIMQGAGLGVRIVVGGFCMELESIYIPTGQSKRLKIFFASGEEQQDLDLALRAIADGSIDVGPWIGARIGLTGVEAALEGMRHPSAPIRTVVDPRQL